MAVTLGGEGAYLYGKDGGCMVPGFAVKQIADTNGAGDSFWGGFLYKVSTAEKHLDELTQEDLKELPVSAMQWPVSAWRKKVRSRQCRSLHRWNAELQSDRIHKTVAELNLNCEAIVFMSMSDL